jgi:hypothetical protein
MKRALLPIALCVMTAHPAAAQYGQSQSQSFKIAGDALARYEWTRDIPAPDGITVNEDRYFLQARPRAELNLGFLELGVGGQFNYSDVDNTVLPDGEPRLIVRDNFYSRDSRFDVYYGKVKAGPVVAEGGRMLMPLLLTQMIWDEDLRPLGGAASFEFGAPGSSARFAIRGLYAKDSHWFPDHSAMLVGSVELAIQSGRTTHLVLVGSYVDFRDLDTLDPQIRRQNTLSPEPDGRFVYDYRVADIQARLVGTGQVPWSFVADYCWNTALSEGNKGLWVGLTLGQLGTSVARLEYTYAKIDRDATVAAFNADDFYWGTGYTAHHVDLGAAAGKKSSIHGVASWMQFKDSPIPEERDQWVKRYRVELRYEF